MGSVPSGVPGLGIRLVRTPPCPQKDHDTAQEPFAAGWWWEVTCSGNSVPSGTLTKGKLQCRAYATEL